MRILLSLVLGFSLLLPLAVHAESAVDTTGLRTTAGAANIGNTDTDGDLPTFIGNYIIQPILGLIGLIFFILTLYGGVLWMTAGGNAEQVKKAKGILVNSIIGVIVIVSAFAITEAIFNAVTTGSVTA